MIAYYSFFGPFSANSQLSLPAELTNDYSIVQASFSLLNNSNFLENQKHSFTIGEQEFVVGKAQVLELPAELEATTITINQAEDELTVINCVLEKKGV